MICNKCGATLPESAQFCGKCGEAMFTPASAVEETSVAAVPSSVAEVLAVPTKKRNPLWKVLVALFCVAAVAVGTYFIFFYNQFQGLVEDFCTVYCEGDLSDLEKMAPQAVWDKIFKDTKVLISTIVSNSQYTDAAIKKANEMHTEEEMIEALGNHVEYEFKVLCDHPMTRKDRGNLTNALKDTYDISPDSVEDCRNLHIELTIAGDKDSTSVVSDMECVRIDGTWYLINYYTDRDGSGENAEEVVYVEFQAEGFAHQLIREVQRANGETDEDTESDSWD